MSIVSLPDEILLMIFSQLSVVDQERLSQTCQRLKVISRDKRLFRFTNFFGQYSCTKEMFHQVLRPRHRNIIHLDITSCYWLAPGDICKHVMKMKQLESLYAVDTQLDVIHILRLSQNLQNLKRLSFNWTSEPIEGPYHNPLMQLEFLYVYVTKCNVNFSILLTWLEGCKNLRELWILSYGCEGDQFTSYYRIHRFRFPALETLVVNMADITSVTFFYLRELIMGAYYSKAFRCLWLGFPDPFRCGSLPESKFRNVEYLFPYSPTINIPLQKLKSTCPDAVVNFTASGYPSLTHLHLRPPAVGVTADIEPAVLDNLKSITYTVQCNSSYMNDIAKLFSPNNKLRKVSLEYLHGNVVVSDQRRKIDEFLAVLSKCCPQITELDIRGCIMCAFRSDSSSEHLSDIWKFTNLHKLTLYNLNIQDAKFLCKVTTNCENLKSISLNNLGLQGHCVYLPDICSALKYCKSLKDFRIDHSNLGKINSLVEHLTLCPLIERVVICSNRNKIQPDLASIVDLIVKSSRLVYLICAMPSVTQEQERRLNKTVKERFLKRRPALIVKVTKQVIPKSHGYGIVHLTEMVCPHPLLVPIDVSLHITGLP